MSAVQQVEAGRMTFLLYNGVVCGTGGVFFLRSLDKFWKWWARRTCLGARDLIWLELGKVVVRTVDVDVE
jgi:hypothetical protein